MSIIERFHRRALTFQRKYPDLKWQHCCVLASYYTRLELEADSDAQSPRQARETRDYFQTFLGEAVREAGTSDPLRIMQYTIDAAEKHDGGRDDGAI